MSVNNFDPKDKIIVVTGGAHGIGCGLAKEFHNQGAAHIIVADMDIDKAGSFKFLLNFISPGKGN